MNSMEFKKKCESDTMAKLELESIFRSIRNMHDAKTFDELTSYYNYADYYRHGLWCYFCGMSDSSGMVYCSHLISVLSKIYNHCVDKLCKKRG